MNFFKLYIGDYQRDTAHLSINEHGAYMLMLQHYYATEKPLPTGKALYRMLRADGPADREAIDSIATQFWTETAAGLVNERAHEEITKAETQADTNRRIAVEREGRRKEHEQSTNRTTKRDTNRPTIDEPIHSHSQTPKPEPDSRTSTQSAREWKRPEVSRGSRGTSNAIAKIRASYPRGIYRDAEWLTAEHQIGALIDQGTHPAELVASAIAYELQQQALGRIGTQYVLGPAKFFNGKGEWRGPFPMPAEVVAPEDKPSVITWRPPPDKPKDSEAAA